MQSPTRRSALAALGAAVGAPSFAFAHEIFSLKGMILERQGARILLRTGTGEVPVRILDTTKVQSTVGVLGP